MIFESSRLQFAPPRLLLSRVWRISLLKMFQLMVERCEPDRSALE